MDTKCVKCGKEEPVMYIHSKCCNAHWELQVDTKTQALSLKCEVCGKDAGI